MIGRYLSSMASLLLLVLAGPGRGLAEAPPASELAHGPRKLGREVAVRDLIRMAQEAARRSSPAKIEGLVRRARLSGAVPQLRLGVERGMGQDLSSTTSANSDRSNASIDDDLTLEATLTFDLGRLVFASDEVRLLALERWLVADRQKLVEEVVRLYFKRVTLLTELAELADDPTRLAQLGEAEALLDALTDGAFGRALAQLGARSSLDPPVASVTSPRPRARESPQ